MSGFAPSQMFEIGFDPLKGWPRPTALDKSAKWSDDVTFQPIGGSVVHLNEDGLFETGVDETSMPIFLIQPASDYDVQNPGTSARGVFAHRAISPTGVSSGLVAVGAYELSVPAFQTDLEYFPGQLLTAPVDNTDAEVGGLLTNAGSGASGDVQQFVDPVCGVVSGGKRKNHNEVWVLDFWPVWLPGAYVA